MKTLIALCASLVLALFSGGLAAHAQYYTYPYPSYSYPSNNVYRPYDNYTYSSPPAYGTSYNYYPSYGPITGQTLNASAISNTSAILNGAVFSGGSLTQYRFEYGMTVNLGASTPNVSVSGQTPLNVSYQLTGLVPNTAYFYRFVAQNNFGSGMPGQILSFTTGASYANYQNNGNYISSGQAQTAKTDAPYPVGIRSATLNGTVNPNGLDTSYYFEYGKTPDLGASTASRNVGNGTSDIAAFANISNLAPDTLYYYRIGAESQKGVVVGATLNFTTRSDSSSGASVNTNSSATTAPSQPSTASGNTPAMTDAYTPTNSYGMGAQLLSIFGAHPTPCFTLSGSLSSKSVSPGGTTSYTVSGRNSCSTNFTNTVLRITIPAAMQLSKSSSAYSSVDGNTYTYNLGDFPNASALSVTVTSVADKNAADNTPIAFTGTVEFDDGGTHQTVGTTSSGEISVSILASIGNLFRPNGNQPMSTPTADQTSNISFSGLGSSALVNIFLILGAAALVLWFVFRNKRSKKVPVKAKAVVSHQPTSAYVGD